MNVVPKVLQEYREAAMTGLLRVSPELGSTPEDLADLPDAFPTCLIRGGKIARADGLHLSGFHQRKETHSPWSATSIPSKRTVSHKQRKAKDDQACLDTMKANADGSDETEGRQ